MSAKVIFLGRSAAAVPYDPAELIDGEATTD
jgi:hypothetical protein